MGVEPRSAPAAELFDVTLAWTVRWFDSEVGAVWNPPGSFGEPARARTFHLTPNSAWFAFGALASGRDDLRPAGLAALRVLLDGQYDAPGEPWDGSFPRVVESPVPGRGARMWEDYDPNWRQFVGLTFAVLVEDLADELGPSLVAELVDAIRRCVLGEPDGRIAASYTNPALMRSWLDAWYGARVGDDALVARGVAFAASVVELFDGHGAFDEFNSPTYYGIDLLALRVWQELAPTPWFAEQGARLEAAVWASAATFFNPALGTFAGPFTRAYTPDARRAVTLMALWVWADAGRAVAPLPDLDAPSVDHGHDLMAGPLIARLWAPRSEPVVGSGSVAGAGMGPVVGPGSGSGSGSAAASGSGSVAGVGGRFVVHQEARRRVEVSLAGGRRITTEISPSCSVGLESSPNDWGGWNQFMPLVVQWRDAVAVARGGDGGSAGEVEVLWLTRPGVVAGELSVESVGGGDSDRAVVELEVAGEGERSVELLTSAGVQVADTGDVRLGRSGSLLASCGGRPVDVVSEGAGQDLKRLVVTIPVLDATSGAATTDPVAGSPAESRGPERRREPGDRTTDSVVRSPAESDDSTGSAADSVARRLRLVFAVDPSGT